MQSFLTHQYQLVKSSREVVFGFFEQMAPGYYTAQVENFGKGGTIHSLQAHCANTYLYWLGVFAQGKTQEYFKPENITTVQQMREAFEIVNSCVDEFFKVFEDRFQQPVNTAEQLQRKLFLSPLDLFTHVITHEFHHKGQIMTMGRMLGYTPPDTDIIR